MEFKIIFPLTDKSLETTKQGAIELPPDLNERQQEIMKELINQKGNPLKLKELQELLKNRYPERTLRRELNVLKV